MQNSRKRPSGIMNAEIKERFKRSTGVNKSSKPTSGFCFLSGKTSRSTKGQLNEGISGRASDFVVQEGKLFYTKTNGSQSSNRVSGTNINIRTAPDNWTCPTCRCIRTSTYTNTLMLYVTVCNLLI